MISVARPTKAPMSAAVGMPAGLADVVQRLHAEIVKAIELFDCAGPLERWRALRDRIHQALPLKLLLQGFFCLLALSNFILCLLIQL